jgi:hypothetical protein
MVNAGYTLVNSLNEVSGVYGTGPAMVMIDQKRGRQHPARQQDK